MSGAVKSLLEQPGACFHPHNAEADEPEGPNLVAPRRRDHRDLHEACSSVVCILARRGKDSPLGCRCLVLMVKVGRTHRQARPRRTRALDRRSHCLEGRNLPSSLREQCCGDNSTRTDAVSAEASEDTPRAIGTTISRRLATATAGPMSPGKRFHKTKTLGRPWSRSLYSLALESICIRQCREAAGCSAKRGDPDRHRQCLFLWFPSMWRFVSHSLIFTHDMDTATAGQTYTNEVGAVLDDTSWRPLSTAHPM